MPNSVFDFFSAGLLDLSLLQILAVLLTVTFITVLTVTLYLHRSQAHRGVDFHPVLNHFFRFWSWLTTGMVTREWVAIHRKHHAFCETENDPHSPQTHGIAKVLFHGVDLYRQEAFKPETIEKYGVGTPDDWIERNLYRWEALGPALLFGVDFALFGSIGITFWALQMIWIPFFAAGVINGLGHWWGYRNFDTPDTSTNLTPWGILLGGEELHNNHHAFPSSAKFALAWFEFDIGWQLLRLLRVLRLASIRKVAPELACDRHIAIVDLETLRAIFAHRYGVMRHYFRAVILPTLAEEAHHRGESVRRWKRKARRVLGSEGAFLSTRKLALKVHILDHHPSVRRVCEYRERLRQIWARTSTDPEVLLKALREWCQEAEQSGVQALRDFATELRSYRLQPAA